MKTLALIALFLGIAVAVQAKEKMIGVVERNGRVYVPATKLARDAGIAIKHLPGRDQIVACSQDRCAVVKDFLREANETLVGVTALSQALGATTRYDAKRQKVAFQFSEKNAPAVEASASVGQVAPNFRLTKLDGRPVALSDFRGKRVLIDSWASW